MSKHMNAIEALKAAMSVRTTPHPASSRCLTCTWWGKDYSGACAFVDTIMADAITSRFTIKASADDDQGLTARLMTGPGFGCIHHSHNRPDY